MDGVSRDLNGSPRAHIYTTVNAKFGEELKNVSVEEEDGDVEPVAGFRFVLESVLLAGWECLLHPCPECEEPVIMRESNMMWQLVNTAKGIAQHFIPMKKG